jgi:hypothetical protein
MHFLLYIQNVDGKGTMPTTPLGTQTQLYIFIFFSVSCHRCFSNDRSFKINLLLNLYFDFLFLIMDESYNKIHYLFSIDY